MYKHIYASARIYANEIKKLVESKHNGLHAIRVIIFELQEKSTYCMYTFLKKDDNSKVEGRSIFFMR